MITDNCDCQRTTVSIIYKGRQGQRVITDNHVIVRGQLSVLYTKVDKDRE